MDRRSGFREHAHTADWKLEVWAPDLPELLRQAALGMQALSGIQLRQGTRHEYSFTLDAIDKESLLVRFLSELLWLVEHDHIGFEHFDLQVSGLGDSLNANGPMQLKATVLGAPITTQAKEIKAVTYHNLQVHQSAGGFSAFIVFDV